ncbi:MAG: hypothetical protein HKN94_06995 [Acidimicrobiales bacterium]|nr:hypothetical protein [Acidimicrobiales bacterium]RZV47524.1 MAG: hypothetical protein EX269_04650 [Acidimicrobiales bacterium]
MVLALVSPALRNADGFPLSTYPMYAGDRSPVMSFVGARGLTPSGDVVQLSIGVQAATDDPLIAESRFRRAKATDALELLCAEIAVRAQGSGSVATVELVEQVFDLREDSADPSVEVLTSCEVAR